MSEIIRYKPSEMADAILGLDSTILYPTGIEVVTPPTKLEYNVGDSFDPTGIFIEASFNDNFLKDVSNSATYNPAIFVEEGTQSVIATYSNRGISKYSTINVIVRDYSTITWADGTDEEIRAMVAAADRGEIDLTDYWHVGDERTISLSAMNATGVGESHIAQNVTMVLVDKNNQNYTYVTTPASGRTYPYFIVQQKNGLSNGTSNDENGYINSTGTSSGSWNGCARRTWCNSVYRMAIPSTIRDIFHQVKVKTAETYNGTTIQQSDDYFFLPAAAEVFKGDPTYGQGGSAGAQTAYSNLTEFNALSRWEYYTTIANRIKKQGDSGAANRWWGRSPNWKYTNSFCCVESAGDAESFNTQNTFLIAPAGCI